MSVFVLQHVNELEEGFEDIKFIGVYSTRQNAEEAIRRLSNAPGFCITPQGFVVEEYELDVDHWQEGFVDTTGDMPELGTQ